MKRTITLLSLFLLVLMPSMVLGASEPNLISSFEIANQSVLFNSGGLNYYRTDIPTAYDKYPEEQIYYHPSGTYITNDYVFAVWDDYVATLSQTGIYQSISTDCLLEIYNWRTGSLVYETALDVSCNYGYLLYDGAGNLIVGLDTVGSQTSIQQQVAVYDVSNIGFIGQRNYSGLGTTTITDASRDSFVVSSTGETVEWFGHGWKYKINSTDAITRSARVVDELFVPQIYGINLFDKENGVFVDSDVRTTTISDIWNSGYDDFYRIDGSDLDVDSYDNPTLIGTVEANVGVIADWNNNYLNPEYITTEGHLMIVGGSDYDNFQTSSANLNFTPKFFFERDNIIGVKNNKWVYADMTDLSAITEGVGTADVNADFMIRFDDNKILTYNRTNFEFKIYEVPLPSFADEEAIASNTPPSKTLELLGVDQIGRFVFAGTFSDDEGGLIFEALKVGTPNDFLYEEYAVQRISYPKTPDRVITECPDYTTHYGAYELGSAVIQNPTVVDMQGFGGLCMITHDYETITALQTDNITITGEFSMAGYSGSPGDFVETTVALYDDDSNIISYFIIGAELFESPQPHNVTVLGNGFDFLVNQEPLNDDEARAIFNFEFEIDFVAQETKLSLWEYSTYDVGGVPSRDYLISNATIPFINTVDSFSEINIHLFGEEIVLIAGQTQSKYFTQQQQFPEYELVDDLDAYEVTVVTLRTDDIFEPAYYNAYLYSTDNTLGLEYYENPYQLSFLYDEDIPTLTEQEIQSAISDLLAGAGDGFNTPNFVEGDLVTDTIFGYFDQWNIKTTASKFLVGLLIILIIIGVGGYLGVLLESPIVSTVGALFGGIGGLFLVTYWGLFPAWVTFTIALITLVVLANMIRNGLTGRGS